KKILIRLPKENEEEIKATIEGLDLSNYTFDKYISKKDESNFEINLDIPDKYKKLLDETIKINTQVKFTRDLINENSEDMTPLALEKLAKEFAKKNKLKIKILNEKEIQKEKLNLLWAVGKGSQFPPRLIILEYNGNPKSKEITALVGKGITFDTGGINLKPSGFLEDMKCDMGGAATAFGTFRASVETKLKKNLILVMSCAENAISGKAYKPGDVFISHANISVEIANTDAEGRLALADALSYLQKKYKPTTIIDLATLTGASLVALGPSLIAMMGNDKSTMKQIFESGEKTFERVWELPIYDEHRDLMKSKIADIKNLGGKFGGCITAGAFLEKFIKENIKWVHLDIAGAAYARKSDLYIPEFGTGRGVRLLVDYLKNN
ncbi:MAG: leucyl aminopeptidase family protein, partial [Nanoarchaeota archaeon]|nr:leucyl aminopeptidase family protein [Nanoarchaeota archaeon]